MVADPVTLTVSWSEVQTWRQCPMKHYLSYRQRQPRTPDSRAQSVGKIWHAMQQSWYQGRKDGTPFEQVIAGIPADFLGWQPESETDTDILSTLMWMWDGFLINGDPFPDWEVVEIEREHLIPLPPIPGQPAHVDIVLKAIIDLVLRKQTRYRVVDHKSQNKVTDADTMSRDMDMDDQLSTYLAAIGMKYGVQAHKMSACWNYAVTTDLKRTPRLPADRYWQADSARTQLELACAMREFSESVLDAYARPLAIEPPRAPDKENCRWRCDHRSRCFYARAGDRSVELDDPVKADQVPDGLARIYAGRQ